MEIEKINLTTEYGPRQWVARTVEDREVFARQGYWGLVEIFVGGLGGECVYREHHEELVSTDALVGIAEDL